MTAGARERPLARAIVCLAILVLGGAAASRLELAYLPAWSFPELVVWLGLPETSDVDELTRRWVLPLESAIRAVGDVTSTAGEVDAAGAYFRVRFAAGSDPERKAARLESEVAALRRRLPQGSQLGVRPLGQGGGERSMVLWLGTEDGGGSPGSSDVGRSFVDAVRALPEVRAVDVAGQDRRELRVVSRGAVAPPVLAGALDDALAVHRLGEMPAGGRRLPVFLRRAPATAFDDLAVRQGGALLPLAALADLSLVDREAQWIVHRQGRRGQVLLVSREYEASPLALERALRRTLARFGLAADAHFLVNEAEPLRRLLERMLLAFAVAVVVTTLAAGVIGGPRAAAIQALALPVALAAAANAYWLAGLSLDATTLPMLALALGWCLFFPALRRGGLLAAAATVAVAATLLPIAAALAGGRLAPLFQTPTRAFLCAQLAAVAALAVLPRASPGGRLGPFLHRRWRPAAAGRPLRAALRRPDTVLLGGVTGTYALFVLFGAALAPRPGSLSPVYTDLRVELRFAEGTPPRQAEAQVSLIEDELSSHEEIAEHSAYLNDRDGVVNAGVRPGDRAPAKLRRLASRLQAAVNALGASARVVPLATGARRGDAPVRFRDDLEDRAEADPEMSFYRFVLRATDLGTLRAVHAQIVERLAELPGVTREGIRSDWGRPEPRLELVPRPGSGPAAADAAVALLRQRAALPPSRELASTAEVDLRVTDRFAPASADEVRSRHQLLGLQLPLDRRQTAPEDVGRRFAVREVVASPTVKRQAGRYVLPVTVGFYSSPVGRAGDREQVDRLLRLMPLAAGCDLELPELRRFVLGAERRRLLAIAAVLPLLLWTLAACRLDSITRGAVALAPLAVALAAVAPWVRLTQGRVDEMTLFTLAATGVGGFPLVLATLAAASERRAGDYRWLADHALEFLVAGLGLVVLLAVPGWGVDADRHPWAMPLRLAAVAGGVLCLASVFGLPGLLRAARYARRRPERRARRRATREAWRAPGPLALSARRLTKVYGDGFKALKGVDCHLEPGIIGLLGPNGAGKTTLLRTLCGLLEPSRGQVCFREVPITPDNLPEYRRLVGFLPQDFNAYEGFTGARFLDYWALEKGIRDPRVRRREIAERLAQVGLEDAAGRKVRDYSGGMRRRIGIARALLGDPPIVIVDEPTTGLDVAARNRLRESLLRVAGERVIVFSTHLASDVAAAAARVLLLHDGRLLYDGPARGLVERARGAVFEAMIGDDELREFSHRYRVTTRVRTVDGIRVRAVVPEGEAPPGRPVEPNLEEAYLAIMSQQSGRERRTSRGARSFLDLDAWRDVGA